MKSLTDFALNEEYKHIQKLGDKLAELDTLVDWEAFRPIVNQLITVIPYRVGDRTQMKYC